MRGGAGDDRDLAGHLDAHATPLTTARRHHFGGAQRADFNIGREADPEDLARLASGLALLEQFFPVGELLSLLECALIIAAVVGQTRGGLERKLARLGKVLLTDLDAVQAEFSGNQVPYPLDTASGF